MRSAIPQVLSTRSFSILRHSLTDQAASARAIRNAMKPNLYNKNGLLASPFGTDDWPGTTGKAIGQTEFSEKIHQHLLVRRGVRRPLP
ncbi:MAG: hypothetical protein DMG41_32825 [Acidobacteria bacterium]|nr:MAG: hypothetical protein AUH13_17070 [Acidobacteria bacterium 13_2_20CM_58_27]PYT82728.1 MAG: hypothetical protein DMG41_32825 [Acidobacteriota bacterium]